MEIIKDKRSGGLDLTVNLPTRYLFGGERIKKDEHGDPVIDKKSGEFVPEKTTGLQEVGSDLASIPKMMYTKENGFGGNLEGAGKNVVSAGREAINAFVTTAKSGGGLDDLKDNYNEGISNAELSL